MRCLWLDILCYCLLPYILFLNYSCVDGQHQRITTSKNRIKELQYQRRNENNDNNKKKNETVVIRWAMSGGGWRSMVANIGFFNSFVKAGLVDLQNNTCKISAASANSGSTWLLTQLVYSKPFFTKAIVPNNPDAIYKFVIDWMNSLRQLIVDKSSTTKNNDEDLRLCPLLGVTQIIGMTNNETQSLCTLFTRMNFSWATLIDEMFIYASKLAYNDTIFHKRFMKPENRIKIFQKMDILAQISIMPVSEIISTKTIATVQKNNRFRIFGKTRSLQQEKSSIVMNNITYLGPKNNNSAVFTVPIPSQYTVTSNGSKFIIGLITSMLPLQVHSGPAPNTFKFDMWDEYYYYNSINNGSIVTSLPKELITKQKDSSKQQQFRLPFNGTYATVTQISAISSASLTANTGAIPVFMAQRLSVQRYNIQQNKKLNFIQKASRLYQLEFVANLLYNNKNTADLAICSQWPQKCQPGDYRLVDGAGTDGPSLAMNIASYQTQNPKGYLGVTMKVIMTNTNHIDDTTANLLSYFSTYFNKGISPGEFIWAPGVIFQEPTQRTPWQSMQIFKEYMDDKTLLKGLTIINSESNHIGNVSSGVFNCTTVNNPAFGVKGGQKVQLMMIRLNSAIPTNVFSLKQLDTWTKPLANMAYDLATDELLAKRIKQFVN